MSDSEEHKTDSGFFYASGGKYTYTDSVDKAPELLFKAEPLELKQKISLKRNDTELDVTKIINDILDLKQKLQTTFNEIQNWVPKVGWSVTLQFDIFQGTISGEWGNRHPENPIDPRYLNVESYYALNIKVKLVALEIKFTLGVDFSIPSLLAWFNDAKVFELIVKAEGTISCETSVNAKITNGDFEPIDIDGQGEIDALVHGKVEFVGYVAEYKGGFAGGISFKGALKTSLKQAPRFEGKFIREEGYIYVTYTIPKDRKVSSEYKRILWSKKDPIWEFALGKNGA